MNEQFHPSACLYVVTPLQNPPFQQGKKPHVNHIKGLTKLYIMYKSRRTTPAAFSFFSIPKFIDTKKVEQHCPTFPSLLSDSNQRPRDYKSRALAN